MGGIAKAVFTPFQKILGMDTQKLKDPKPDEDVLDVEKAQDEIDQEEISSEQRKQLDSQKKRRANARSQERSLLGTGVDTSAYNSLLGGGQSTGNRRLGGF